MKMESLNIVHERIMNRRVEMAKQGKATSYGIAYDDGISEALFLINELQDEIERELLHPIIVKGKSTDSP